MLISQLEADKALGSGHCFLQKAAEDNLAET
jgi:hypothetical protein